MSQSNMPNNNSQELDLASKLRGKEDEISDTKRDIKMRRAELEKTHVRLHQKSATLTAVREMAKVGTVSDKTQASPNEDGEIVDRAIQEKKNQIDRLMEVVDDQGKRIELQVTARERLGEQLQKSEEQINQQKYKMRSQENALKELTEMLAEQSKSLVAFQAEHYPQHDSKLGQPELLQNTIIVAKDASDEGSSCRDIDSTPSSRASQNSSHHEEAQQEVVSFSSLQSRTSASVNHEYGSGAYQAGPQSSVTQQSNQSHTTSVEPSHPQIVHRPSHASSRYVLRNNIICIIS
eukprot:TRINITY_DN10552_c0_g5_i2.p1 TRINITY_DN10552_c0_g5~~TRINITY_DN10552_c0_g5_i2.p1  ORF type:complete len:292 (+),score=47.67 TRINITY_DN10552_c0_g5_i2:116-991(+)